MDIDGAQCGPEANNGGRSLPRSYRRDIKEFLMANPPESRLAKVNGPPATPILMPLLLPLPPP